VQEKTARKNLEIKYIIFQLRKIDSMALARGYELKEPIPYIGLCTYHDPRFYFETERDWS